MCKPLSSYPEDQRMKVAMRRANSDGRGMGYLSAVAFLNKKGIYTKEQKLAAAVNSIMKNAGMEPEVIEKRRPKHGPLRRQRREKPVSSLSERSKRTLAAFRKQYV